MLRRSFLLRDSRLRRTPEEIEDELLYNQILSRKPSGAFSFRAMTATKMQGWMAAVGVLVGAAFFMGPWLWDELRELGGYKFVPMDPSQMPHTSPEWWENEWRKMNPSWRAGESVPWFFVGPYKFVKQQTGRDLSSAFDFRRTAPSSSPSHSGEERRGLWSRLTGRASASPATKESSPPRALVPLCGDSPIVKTMALQGFEVDAVDSSQTAMQLAVERAERGMPLPLYDHIHLHWMNFFAPELWEGPLKNKKYDVIYERQGMTSLNREQRSDYAYLLKQAVKEDGVIYVEGIFRTGRVKGNKLRGPPYSLSRKEMEHLFPNSEGFFVRCEEKTDAMMQLSRENRVLKRVPKEMYVTPFSCVVFKDAAVNLETREEPLTHPEEVKLTANEYTFGL